MNTASDENCGTPPNKEGASQERLAWTTVKLDAILDQSAAAIVLCDENGIILEASRLARRLYEGDPIARPFEQVFPLLRASSKSGANPKSPTRFQPAFSPHALPWHGLKVFLKRKGGRKLPFLMDRTPIHTEGHCTGWVVTLNARIGELAKTKAASPGTHPSREQLRKLAARIQELREAERAAVAREIHDVLAQDLTRLKIDIAWVERRLETPLDETTRQILREKLSAMNRLADTAISSVQRIATDLRPIVLDSLGLCAALEWQTRDFQTRTGIACDIALPNIEIALDRERSTALFRILQESLTNVARHANATQVTIRLHADGRWLLLTIQDNGRGFESGKLKDLHAIGLLGMRERALLLDGYCKVFSQPGGGTRVEAKVPHLSWAKS